MKFSIITPSYNQLDWLRLCVASVRDQIPAAQNSVLCVEHIIQDAGSEGIEEFAREVGADFYKNNRLIFADGTSPGSPAYYKLSIFCEADNGMYDAINRGLRRSNGEICAWINCDEQYLPATLEVIASFMHKNSKIHVVTGDTILLNDKLDPKAYRKAVTPDRRYMQTFQMNLHSSSLFFRRIVLDQGHWLGTRFRSIGDAEWIAGMLEAGISFQCIAVPLSTFVLASTNLSKNVISTEEADLWRSELGVSAPYKYLLKVKNFASRFACGVYLPKCVGISIFTTEDIAKRTLFSPRWLDFRFRI